MRAIDYLADGLEHIDKGNYWRSYALEYLTAMLGRTQCHLDRRVRGGGLLVPDARAGGGFGYVA
jgi:hypothetical protein